MNCVRCLSTIVPGSQYCGNCGLIVSQSVPLETGEHEPTYLRDRMILEILAGPGSGQRFPIGAVARVGRANGNEVQLFDAEVSRLHAVIYRYDQGFAIVDQDSANGTFVNGTRIGGPTWINPGDKIIVGRSQILVSNGFGAQAADAQVKTGEPRAGISPWVILGVVAAIGFLLLAGGAFIYFLFF